MSRTSFLGRDRERQVVTDRLQRARLVTLTGIGGCGKTRLALEVAADLVDAFSDGVWLVDLAAVQVSELVPYAVATVFGRRERAGEGVLDALVGYLGTRELLLVLDNCEHLIDACANLAERILDDCPDVKVLATSRERLRIAGEATVRVSSLAAPDARTSPEPVSLLAYPAVQLFVERARAVQPAFALGADNASTVAAVCARLEGLPLALELAAAFVLVLSPVQILEQLDDSIRLLAGGSRTAPRRQQTMRATLDWSHGLLSDSEQVAFRRLAVFAGGWTLEGAETVCAGAEIARSQVLELLTRLVDKSLVTVGERDMRARYRFLEPVRQYARQRLVSCGELEQARRNHAAFILNFAESFAGLFNNGGPRRASAVKALKDEYRDVQAALQYALDTGNADLGLRLAATLWLVWEFHLPLGEGHLWIEQLLRLPGAEMPTPARARALLIAARLAWSGKYDHAAALAYFAEAFPLARQLDDPGILYGALIDRGNLAVYEGDPVAARAYYDEALAIARASGARALQASVLENIAWVTVEQGDYAAARFYGEQAMSFGRELGDHWLISGSSYYLQLAALGQRDFALARSLAEECLTLDTDWFRMDQALSTLILVDLADGHRDDARRRASELLAGILEFGQVGLGNARPIETFAAVMAHLGYPDVAVRIAAAVEAAWQAVGVTYASVNRDLRDRWLVPVRRKMRDEDFQTWWAKGLKLSLDDALALVREPLLHYAPEPETRVPEVFQRSFGTRP